MLRVRDVIDVLERSYPTELAEPWDVVGLAIGSRAAAVSTVLFSVDVTVEVLAEAAEVGAELVVAHHPPLLRGLTAVDLDHPKGRLVGAALSAGIAVYVAHTNADVAPRGVVEALAAALGVQDRRPLRPRAGPALDKVVTFVPHEHADHVTDALARAGAGRLGAYERCAFTSTGTGSFRPLPGADPFLGRIGEVAQVPETRIEMVLPRSSRDAVLTALLDAHPYETPAYDVVEMASGTSGMFGLGRVGDLGTAVSLSAFADVVAAAVPATAAGVRVAGDPDREVRTVAVQAGAGDDLFDDVRRSGADVYVTSDLRHHPTAEALAWPGAPALVDVPHWAAEWTWLPVVRDLVAEETGLRTHLSTLRTDPWNGRR